MSPFKQVLTTSLAAVIAVPAVFIATGCEPLLPGLPAEEDIFDGPIDGLSEAQLRTFIAGDEAFAEFFTADTGLGPVFNAPSCINCHPGDGRGHPAFNLIRFGRGDSADSASFDYLEELGGPQLQDRAIPGYQAEILPDNVAVSPRGGPVVTGLGLLEAVPAADILAREDADDLDGDGISGRANFVPVPDFLSAPADCVCAGCQIAPTGCEMLARFGRKATAIDLHHQTVVAYLNDMGVTSDELVDDVFNPTLGGPSGDAVADPEVGSESVANVVFYLQTLRPPARRNDSDSEVLRGQQLFADIGCAACHTPELQTGAHPIGALSNRTARAYTDLLLHDMGPALADGYPEARATGNEWRTTPLWGLGIVAGQLGGEAYYLHDGRARTLHEAIDLHGGEAERARADYLALSAIDRDALTAFLQSL